MIIEKVIRPVNYSEYNQPLNVESFMNHILSFSLKDLLVKYEYFSQWIIFTQKQWCHRESKNADAFIKY